MAIKSDVAKDTVFIGEDKILSFSIFDTDGVTPLDVSGFAMKWDLRKTDKAADPAVIEKATGGAGITITGAFNVNPAINTQRVRVALSSAETDALRVLTYRHALKRTDVGAETVLSYGDFPVSQSTVR